MDELGGLLGILGALGAVLLLAGGALLLARFAGKLPVGGGQAGKGSPVRFLRSIPVGSRERVTLISYRGEVFMLGVSQGSVTLLARLEEEALPEGDEAAPAPSRLAQRFREAMDRARNGSSSDEAA